MMATSVATIASRPTRSTTIVAGLSGSWPLSIGLQGHGIHEVTGSIPVWSTIRLASHLYVECPEGGIAGLKHFVIEQDNAASWGDSLAAARVSYQNMRTVLS